MLGLHHSTACKAEELAATIQPGLHHTAMKWLFLASESLLLVFFLFFPHTHHTTYRIFSIISAVLIFFQHPSTPCFYWRPHLYWRPCLYFFNQYIHTEQEEIHARYHACSIDFQQDRAKAIIFYIYVSRRPHAYVLIFFGKKRESLEAQGPTLCFFALMP